MSRASFASLQRIVRVNPHVASRLKECTWLLGSRQRAHVDWRLMVYFLCPVADFQGCAVEAVQFTEGFAFVMVKGKSLQ